MNRESLRAIEAKSIYDFVASCGDLFRDARVLDYGCGQQPYKDLVESFGPARYQAYDRDHFHGSVGVTLGDPFPWLEVHDVVLCTQVIQYVPLAEEWLGTIRAYLHQQGGRLVLTGPTNWPEVEEDDWHRFTIAGMRRMLERQDFTVERLERRAAIEWQGESFSLGWGAVARA